MKKQFYYVGALALTVLLNSCEGDSKKVEEVPPHSKKTTFVYQDVVPEEMPTLDIPGFSFPMDSTVLNKWIQNEYNDSIYMHGWGIWTGLTSMTTQKATGESDFLRVYETWMTPEEMIAAIKTHPELYQSKTRSNRANLRRPHQFTHFASAEQSINDSIHETVSYNPAASKFAIDNKIFMATTLYDMAKSGKKEVSFFPKNALTIKPVFKVLNTSNGETKFNIAAWKGPKDELKAFPEQDWESFVTVDVSPNAKASGSVYPLKDFIHYKLNKEDAYFFNKEFSENSGNKFNAKAGDIAILVGMHVGSREISNWTWQTFWWEATPDSPQKPSSDAIAAMRPDKLKGAARHYAMALAYYMVNPNEPVNGKDVKGEPMYAYNPYLEAGFGPGTFDTTISYINTTDNGKLSTYSGVRTNCMSCHRMASVNPNKLDNPNNNSQTPYVGNSFVSRNDSLFKGQLLLDFAWSIQGNVDTTGISNHMKK